MQPTPNGAGTFLKLGGQINVGSRGPIKGLVGYRGKAPVGVRGGQALGSSAFLAYLSFEAKK